MCSCVQCSQCKGGVDVGFNCSKPFLREDIRAALLFSIQLCTFKLSNYERIGPLSISFQQFPALWKCSFLNETTFKIIFIMYYWILNWLKHQHGCPSLSKSHILCLIFNFLPMTVCYCRGIKHSDFRIEDIAAFALKIRHTAKEEVQKEERSVTEW